MADYTDLRGRFVYRRTVYWSELDTLAENDAHFEENGWEDGCKAVFFQASAPLGWTKDTTAALDGKTIRIVSGTGGGTGGTSPIASALSLAHTHGIVNQAAHTHVTYHQHPLVNVSRTTYGGPGSPMGSSGGVLIRGTGVGTPVTSYMFGDPATVSGSDGSHNHGGTSGPALSDVTLAYVDVIVCSRDASSGYTDLTAVFSTGMEIEDGAGHTFQSFGLNDDYSKDRLIVAGTVMNFYLTSAPVGWTKQTSQNGKALRIVTGSGGGSGGTKDPSTAVSLAHSAHSITSGGDHQHTLAAHIHTLGTTSFSYFGSVAGKVYIHADGTLRMRDGTAVTADVAKDTTKSAGACNLDASGNHAHSVGSALADTTLAYANVIQASKDVYDASPYTDMTTFFADDNLLAWQELETLAQNDEWLNNNQVPTGAVTFFYQAAAPLTWTKQTSLNDCLLRIVSGDGGSSGGTLGISTGITLAHQHTVGGTTHIHNIPNHAHELDTVSDPNAGNVGPTYNYYWAYSSGKYNLVYADAVSYSVTRDVATKDVTATWYGHTEYSFSHNHSGNLNSGGSNITLAYADAVMCQKD